MQLNFIVFQHLTCLPLIFVTGVDVKSVVFICFRNCPPRCSYKRTVITCSKFHTGDNRSKNVIFGVAFDRTILACISLPFKSRTPLVFPFSTKISLTS